MENRYFTFMLIPERSSQVKKWVISTHLLRWCAGCVGFILLVGLVSLVISLRHFTQKDEYHSAQLKIQYLEGKLQMIQNKIASSDAALVRVQSFEHKLRELARLNQPSDDDGIGPISPQDHQYYLEGQEVGDGKDSGQEEPTYGYRLKSMELTVEGINRRASLQEQSLQHLYELLRDQRSLLAASPSIWPTRGWVSSHFGYRTSPFTGIRQHHAGVDIVAPVGTKIVAPADGIVSRAGTVDGYGKLVVIKHGYGLVTRYAHNSKILVKVGQKVKRGHIIALVGKTGRATGAHLHYEVHLNGIPVNPIRYILE